MKLVAGFGAALAFTLAAENAFLAPAYAQQFICKDITEVIRSANSDFASIRGRPEPGADARYHTVLAMSNAQKCSIWAVEGRVANYSCDWQFPSESRNEAVSAYRSLVETVKQCLPGEAAKSRDPASTTPSPFTPSSENTHIVVVESEKFDVDVLVSIIHAQTQNDSSHYLEFSVTRHIW